MQNIFKGGRRQEILSASPDGKKTLDPVFCKRVLRQLKFTDEEIQQLLK